MKLLIAVVLLAVTFAGSGCAVRQPDKSEMLKQSRVTPFLMFQDGNAEAAMRFYISIFPDGRFLQFETHEAGGVALEGKVLLATIEIAGQEVRFSDSPPVHDFDFTPSMSLYVHCAHQEELDRLAAALVDGGEFLMPPADYGFSQKFAFVKDRFGVSWQLNVPHDPTR